MSAKSSRRIWRGGSGRKCLFIAIGLMLTLSVTPLLASPASDARDRAQSAMHAYKRAHPACEICGRPGSLLKPLDVHHIIPVSVAPDQSGDLTNMVTVCRDCHLWVCHAGNYRHYVYNLREWLAKREVRK